MAIDAREDGPMRRTLLIAAAIALALAGCGDDRPAGTPSAGGPVPQSLTVTSDVFTDGQPIPAAYSCAGAGKVPAISWSGDAHGATAFAVIVDDPDAPSGTFVHRVVYDLPATANSLGADPSAPAHEARNSAGRSGWTPPCPPSGTHHYQFTVYGLSGPTGLGADVDHTEAIAAIKARAVAQGRLTGTFSR